MAITVKTSTVNMETVVYANSQNMPSGTQNAHLSLSFQPTTSGDYDQQLVVKKTTQAAFGSKLTVAQSIPTTNATIDSVKVGSDVFTEASGVVYSSASGSVVVVSGSVPSGSDIHSASINFNEGPRSVSGGLTVSDAGLFSATHTYSYPGIYHILTRVQNSEGAVDMDSFRLNLASDLTGSDLGNLTVTATPEGGDTSSTSSLSISCTTTGASGLSIGSVEDDALSWNFGNHETSNKTAPSTRYSEPGTFIPSASFLYPGPS